MSLFDDLTVDLWLTPESGTPGLNAVTAAADFTLTGTADGYATGDGGQPLLQMSATDTITGESTFLSGLGAAHYLNGLHAESQFWILCYWNPKGDTDTFQVALETTNTAAAGYRLRLHGDGTASQFSIHDGTSAITGLIPTVAEGSRWNGSGANVAIFQVDIVNGFIEGWANGRISRTNLNRKSISSLTFPVIGSPTANTIAPRCSLNGDVMLASGSGILTDDQVAMLSEYGKGIDWAKLNTVNSNRQISWRVQPNDTTLRIVGCFSEAPNLRLYAAGSRTTRGSLLDSSGTLSIDAQGWCAHTFTGLTADTEYQVFAEYADGVQDRRRARVKTLPATTDGLYLGFAGCWKWDPEQAISDAGSLEGQWNPTMVTLIDDVAPDVLTHVGDDGYYDNMWADNFSQTPPIELVADFQTVHASIFDQNKVDELFAEIPFFSGCFSDHDYLENDVFGADATAAQIVAAQAHWTQRTGKTFALAPNNMYHSWRTPGITWIALDTRTEADNGVQITSTGQRTQMQSDAAAAVARKDLIVLCSEWPWDSGESPPPAADWDSHANHIAERKNIFDRLATAGVTDKIICVYGDQHAGGLDIQGAYQGGWDTDSIVRPVCILASRFNHQSGGSASGADTHPNHYNNTVGNWINVGLANNGTRLDVTVTPYVQAVAQTAFERTLLGYPANVNKSYRGAVEPAGTGASGNEIQSWRGAVEPTAATLYALTATSTESASEVSAPSANQIVAILATSIQATTEVGAPAIVAGSSYKHRRVIELTGRAN